MKNANKLALELEKCRHTLALNKDYQRLLSTYSSKNEIDNDNSKNLWNSLNSTFSSSESVNPMAHDRLSIISRWITSRSNINKVLNIGFGSANLEEMVFNKKPNYQSWIGMDISNESVVSAQKKFSKAKFIIGDVLKLGFCKHTFDLVLALELLEHISPTKIFKALENIHRVLKPGGVFICSVPLNENLEEMLEQGINPNAHVRTYTPELLTSELHLAGFFVIESQLLYAFNENYKLKTRIAKMIGMKNFNNLIIFSKSSQ